MQKGPLGWDGIDGVLGIRKEGELRQNSHEGEKISNLPPKG